MQKHVIEQIPTLNLPFKPPLQDSSILHLKQPQHIQGRADFSKLRFVRPPESRPRSVALQGWMTAFKSSAANAAWTRATVWVFIDDYWGVFYISTSQNCLTWHTADGTSLMLEKYFLHLWMMCMLKTGMHFVALPIKMFVESKYRRFHNSCPSKFPNPYPNTTFKCADISVERLL